MSAFPIVTEWYDRVVNALELLSAADVITPDWHLGLVDPHEYAQLITLVPEAFLNRRGKVSLLLRTIPAGDELREEYLKSLVDLEWLDEGLDLKTVEGRNGQKARRAVIFALLQAGQAQILEHGRKHWSHFLAKHIAKDVINGWDDQTKNNRISIVREYDHKMVISVTPQDVEHVLTVLIGDQVTQSSE